MADAVKDKKTREQKIKRRINQKLDKAQTLIREAKKLAKSIGLLSKKKP
jgi:hypothetical protein